MTDYDFIDPDLPEENSDEEMTEDEIAVEEMVAEMEAMKEEVEEEEADDLEDYPEVEAQAEVMSPVNPEKHGVDIDSTDINSDKVAEEENTEDNRGFLGRAYNQLKNIL